MTAVGLRRSFMTGLHYLDHQQTYGDAHGSMRMLNRRFEFGKNLYSKDLFAHYGCVNAVEFSNDGEWLVSGGDDKRVLIWNIDKTLTNSRHPIVMKGEHASNIFCLGFSHTNAKLFSAGNDEQAILHDVTTKEVLDVFLHDEAVYGLSVDPVNENVFASACDDGRILIWDARSVSNDPLVLDICSSAYHAVMYNPIEPRFLATANAKDGVCLWDIRKPKVHYKKYGPTFLCQSAMSVRFNSAGTHLLALRRRYPPVLYEIGSTQPTAEFDHNEYYNSCTMKSCCFAGDKDQFVLSGSDDFKLYVWKIPECGLSKKGMRVNKAHFILRGHRSIVNQVRYNDTFGMLASSGVEKIIKLWSSFPLSYQEDSSNYISKKDSLRKVYSHEEYVNLVLESGQFMTHDYSHHSVQEDPRMMAFFDSLVQRDIEGWTSDSSDTTQTMNMSYIVQSSDSTSSISSSEDEDTIRNLVLGGTSMEEQKQGLLVSLSERQEERSAEEKADQSLDRISILIAQKRKQQMLKAQRTSMQKDKKKKRKSAKKSRTLSFGLLKNESTSKTNTTDENGDLRKLFSKTRARLNRPTLLEPDSSESEDDPGSVTWADLVTSNRSSDVSGMENPRMPSSRNRNMRGWIYETFGAELGFGIGSGSATATSTVNSEATAINRVASTSGNDTEVNIPTQSPANGTASVNSKGTAVNGTSSASGSNDTGNTSKTPSGFALMKRKRSGRNYRKRGPDELDE